MPQSHAQIYIHGVFSTKNRIPWLSKELRPELFAYLGAMFKTNGQIPVLFNGHDDHVHLLYGMSRTITVAKTMEAIKSASSKWLKENHISDFAWQTGYGAFGVSHRELSAVMAYIANQEEHHRKVSFQDEYRALLIEHGISFDEKYMWD